MITVFFLVVQVKTKMYVHKICFFFFFDKLKNVIRYILEEDFMHFPSIYYNVTSKEYLRISGMENSFSNKLLPDDHSLSKTSGMNKRISYKSNGCTCQRLTCGCCVGLNIQQFNREGLFIYLFI